MVGVVVALAVVPPIAVLLERRVALERSVGVVVGGVVVPAVLAVLVEGGALEGVVPPELVHRGVVLVLQGVVDVTCVITVLRQPCCKEQGETQLAGHTTQGDRETQLAGHTTQGDRERHS